MYTPSRSPAWHRDVIWCAGVALVVATMVATASFAWARLAEEDRARPLLRETLRATLLPGGSAPALAVDRQEAYVPGEPFEALPGSGVRIDPTEVADFDAQQAVDRIAGVWTSVLLADGTDALADSIENPVLQRQIRTAGEGPVARLVEGELSEEMLGAGLDDGTRVANWPLQVQQNPGEPVQPIVGLFVFVDPERLQGLSDRQVGETVLSVLAETVRSEGAEAGRVAITNVNLEARFEQAISQARVALHELFAALLAGRTDDLAARLDEARSVLADAEAAPTGLEGLLSDEDLTDLSEEEANERILDALAARAWQQGPQALEPALEGDVRSDRLAAARDAIGAFTRLARAEALRVGWIAVVVGAFALVVMAVLATGAGRLARPGAALAFGALPGALVAWWLTTRLPSDGSVPLPAGARAEGVFGELNGLVRYVGAAVPDEAVAVLLRTHGIVAGVGLGLVLTAGILLAIGALRPRRRGYL